MKGRSRGALTPVALRAPSVSAPRTGTFYFAQNRKFLLCLDTDQDPRRQNVRPDTLPPFVCGYRQGSWAML